MKYILTFFIVLFPFSYAQACQPPMHDGVGWVNEMDESDNGYVSFLDYSAYYTPIYDSYEAEKRDELIQANFEALDYNEDDKLVAEEFERANQEYQQRCSEVMMGK